MKTVLCVAMVIMMAGAVWARDDRDGRDWAYGGDDYSINRNKEAEQDRKHERAMEDQRQDMQRQMDSQRQDMQRQMDSQQQNRNLLGW
jgi:hypothetical protein